MSQSFAAALGNRWPSDSEQALLRDMIERDRYRASILSEEINTVDISLKKAAVVLGRADQQLDARRNHLKLTSKLLKHYLTFISTTEGIMAERDVGDVEVSGSEDMHEAVFALTTGGRGIINTTAALILETKKLIVDAEQAVESAKERKRLAEMEIFYLQSNKDALKDQMRHLIDQIHQKEIYFLSVRKVPPELWKQIFEYAADISIKPHSLEDGSLDPFYPSFPLSLSAVCKDWQAICETTSRVWSAVVLRPGLDSPTTINQISKCIRKSGHLIRMLVVIIREHTTALPNYSQIFQQVEIIENLQGYIHANARYTAKNMLERIPPCRYVSIWRLGTTDFILELPEKTFKHVKSFSSTASVKGIRYLGVFSILSTQSKPCKAWAYTLEAREEFEKTSR